MTVEKEIKRQTKTTSKRKRGAETRSTINAWVVVGGREVLLLAIRRFPRSQTQRLHFLDLRNPSQSQVSFLPVDTPVVIFFPFFPDSSKPIRAKKRSEHFEDWSALTQLQAEDRKQKMRNQENQEEKSIETSWKTSNTKLRFWTWCLESKHKAEGRNVG